MDWFVLVFISAVLLSGFEIINKKILRREHSLELLAVVNITIVAILLCLFPFIELKISLNHLIIIFIRSMLVATAILFVTRAMRHLEISSVAPMKNLSPLFLLFLSTIFLGEAISLLQILGIFLIVTGSYFLRIHDHYLDFFRHIKDFKNKYFYYALGSAALLSICAMISKIVLKEVHVTSYLFYSNIFIAAYYVVSLYTHYGGWHDIKFGFKKGSWWVLVLAVLALGSEYTYFTAVAMPAALISLIIPIRRFSSLFTTIVGGRMFHDHYLFHKILSALLLVVGAILIII